MHVSIVSVDQLYRYFLLTTIIIILITTSCSNNRVVYNMNLTKSWSIIVKYWKGRTENLIYCWNLESEDINIRVLHKFSQNWLFKKVQMPIELQNLARDFQIMIIQPIWCLNSPLLLKQYWRGTKPRGERERLWILLTFEAKRKK